MNFCCKEKILFFAREFNGNPAIERAKPLPVKFDLQVFI